MYHVIIPVDRNEKIRVNSANSFGVFKDFITQKFIIMKLFTNLSFKKWILLAVVSAFIFSACQKEISKQQQKEEEFSTRTTNPNAEAPPFNLQVILRGEGKRFGHIKFRQDNDADKIINLDTWVRDLEPNHEYLLQRAVDAINVVDGNCTSTTWLTLGYGLTPHSILTDGSGTANEALWRSVAAVASGSAFDIHFRIVDAGNMSVVLTSDCYKYVVR